MDTVLIKIEKKVSSCQECPYKKHQHGHGENFDYCSHEHSPYGYGNIIATSDIPAWCPFRAEITIYPFGQK